MLPNTYILFHDYTFRNDYHIVEKYLDKIECQYTLQVFKIKNNLDYNLLELDIKKFDEFELEDNIIYN